MLSCVTTFYFFVLPTSKIQCILIITAKRVAMLLARLSVSQQTAVCTHTSVSTLAVFILSIADIQLLPWLSEHTHFSIFLASVTLLTADAQMVERMADGGLTFLGTAVINTLLAYYTNMLANTHLPTMFLPSDLLWEFRIELIAVGLPCIVFTSQLGYAARISGFWLFILRCLGLWSNHLLPVGRPIIWQIYFREVGL